MPAAADFALGRRIATRHDPVRGRELYLASITLAPAQRGRRLGALLLELGIAQLQRQFAQLASALLVVDENRHGARKTYEAAGFVAIGRIDGFFEPRPGVAQVGIVLRRALPPPPLSTMPIARQC